MDRTRVDTQRGFELLFCRLGLAQLLEGRAQGVARVEETGLLLHDAAQLERGTLPVTLLDQGEPQVVTGLPGAGIDLESFFEGGDGAGKLLPACEVSAQRVVSGGRRPARSSPLELFGTLTAGTVLAPKRQGKNQEDCPERDKHEERS